MIGFNYWNFLRYISFSLLLLSTVMNMYAVFGDKYLDIYVSYFAIVLYLAAKLLKIDKKENRLTFPKEFIVFLVYSLLISVICNVTSGLQAMLSITLIIGILSFVTFWKTFEYNRFLKFYNIISIAAVAFLLYQHIVKFITGYGVSGVIPGLSLSEGISENKSEYLVHGLNRFSSFFSEPSHYAQILVPFLIILLLDYRVVTKHKWFKVSLIVISLMLLQSGTAMILLIPLAVIYFVGFWKRTSNKLMAFWGITLLSFIGGFMLFYYLTSEYGGFVNERMSEITVISSDDAGSSGFIRMWRGYFVFADYSTLEMIFGNPNYNSLLNHVYSSHMDLYLEDFALTYFNALQYILLHTGLVGFSLFVYYMFSLWKGNTISGKCIILTLLLLMFVESIYGNPRMALYLILAQVQKISYSKKIIII